MRLAYFQISNLKRHVRDMKKLLMMLVCLLMGKQAIESQPSDVHNNAELDENLNYFDELADELIMHVFSFVPEATSMKAIFKAIARLSLVNTNFNRISQDRPLLKGLAKRYFKLNPRKAKYEFLDTATFLFKSTSSKAYKLIDALAFSIDVITKNKIFLDAVKYNHQKLVEILLDGGANINAVSSYGNTGLLLACMRDNKELVKLLLDRGAEVNVANKYGYTALSWASRFEQKDIVGLLRAKLDNDPALTIKKSLLILLFLCISYAILY